MSIQKTSTTKTAEPSQAVGQSLLSRPGNYQFQLRRTNVNGFEHQHYSVLSVQDDGGISLQICREQSGEKANQDNTFTLKGELTTQGRAGQVARFRGEGRSKLGGSGEVAVIIRQELDAGDRPTGRLNATGTVSGWQVAANFGAQVELQPEIERTPIAEPRSDRFDRGVEYDNCGRVAWSPRPNPTGHLSGAKGMSSWLSARIR